MAILDIGFPAPQDLLETVRVELLDDFLEPDSLRIEGTLDGLE